MKTPKLHLTLASAMLVYSLGSIHAATIVSLGVDTTTGADWRTAATAKSSAFDPDGDNI